MWACRRGPQVNPSSPPDQFSARGGGGRGFRRTPPPSRVGCRPPPPGAVLPLVPFLGLLAKAPPHRLLLSLCRCASVPSSRGSRWWPCAAGRPPGRGHGQGEDGAAVRLRRGLVQRHHRGQGGGVPAYAPVFAHSERGRTPPIPKNPPRGTPPHPEPLCAALAQRRFLRFCLPTQEGAGFCSNLEMFT